MDIAKVFKTGRSQAIRIPKKYRFKSNTVTIYKQGDSIILTPQQSITWDEFFNEHSCSDFTLERENGQKVQKREFFQ
jgi:antitoxin VapB